MILEVFTTGPIQTNVICIGCDQTKKCAFFDPAFGSKNFFIEIMQKYNLSPIAIYLTHSHWDHIANCCILQRDYDLPIYVHSDDAENVIHPGSDDVPLLVPVDGARVDGYLSDKQKIEIGKLQLEVLHTPGHSPGGVCFYEREENILISGDTLFQGTMGSLSLPTSNEKDMISSLKKLSQLPFKTKVIPGHGQMTTIEEETWLQNVEQIFS